MENFSNFWTTIYIYGELLESANTTAWLKEHAGNLDFATDSGSLIHRLTSEAPKSQSVRIERLPFNDRITYVARSTT